MDVSHFIDKYEIDLVYFIYRNFNFPKTTNGTYVNWETIASGKHTALRDGDFIGIGICPPAGQEDQQKEKNYNNDYCVFQLKFKNQGKI